MNESGGFHIGLVSGRFGVIYKYWNPVYFTLYGMMYSTFVERLSAGG